jgi:hypothetical protein
MLKSSDPDVLKFDVLVSVAKDSNGVIDQKKLKVCFVVVIVQFNRSHLM